MAYKDSSSRSADTKFNRFSKRRPGKPGRRFRERLIDSALPAESTRRFGIRFGAGHVFGAQEFRGDAEVAAVEAFMDEAGHSAPGSHDAPNQQRSVIAI